MRKLLAVVAVVAAIPLVLFLNWDTQTRALGNALLADVTAAKQRVIKREPPPREPLHDNGYQCLGGMLDVTAPAFVAAFGTKNVEALEPFITGAKPIAELPAEVRASMVSFSGWAGSMRECGQSMRLSWVDGLAPWAPLDGQRPVRLAEAMPALIDFTALELRVLLGDGQPEVALERCSTTWALAADQSHLGVAGAKTARAAVKRLAPGCTDALKALPAAATPVKNMVGKQWVALKQRLAPVKEVLEAERLGVSVRTFAWVSDEAIRSQLPLSPRERVGVRVKLEDGQRWREWDTAMRRLAEAPAADRKSASDAVDAVIPSQYAAALSDYEQTAVELDALASLAAAGANAQAP